MRAPTIAIVCNALDDATRLQRNITTDSPAASRKVFMMCQALRKAGVRAYVLSLGRGRPDGSAYFKSTLKRINGVPVLYAPFSQTPVLSQVISLFGLIPSLLRMSRAPSRSVVFYNRMTAYLPALLVARLAGFRCLLDLEDGEVATQTARYHPLCSRLRASLNTAFDFLCRDGALLACSALKEATRIRPTICYYGTTSTSLESSRWQRAEITVLMSGTLDEDTGAHLLIEAIQLLRQDGGLAKPLCFEITGKGASLSDFEKLANESDSVVVKVHGRVSNLEYQQILDRSDIGLALKPVGGALANTTFPSKVIEFADAGLLVLTTDISDVRKVLGEGAVYLDRNDPAQLVNLLRIIAADPTHAQQLARQARQTVLEQCAPAQAGTSMATFIQGI
jgi:glycosyltransferase involved in cell wall biosynthesis